MVIANEDLAAHIAPQSAKIGGHAHCPLSIPSKHGCSDASGLSTSGQADEKGCQKKAPPRAHLMHTSDSHARCFVA